MNDGPDQPQRRRRGLTRLLIAGASAVALATAMVALTSTAHAATQICSSQTGTNGGNYYSFWNNGQGSSCITLNSGTSYTTSWSNIGDFVGGVGWNPGSTSRSISYSASLSGNGGTALMALYGWSTSPLVEYYVIDNWVGSPNTAGTNMGTMTSDGGTYTIIEHQQVNQPSIQGTATFNQYLAIRTSPRSSGGTITFSNFVNAWASHGMNLGSMNYQILATEAWGNGSGSSSVNIGGGAPPTTGGPTTQPTTSRPTTSPTTGGGGGSSGCTATLSAGSKGSNWYNLNVSVSGSNTWTVTVNMQSPAVVYSTFNVTASFPSQYVMKATPNGNGNNWGFTVSPNGQWTWPSVSCSTS
jgi:endo-1,4-beta-xylanase